MALRKMQDEEWTRGDKGLVCSRRRGGGAPGGGDTAPAVLSPLLLQLSRSFDIHVKYLVLVHR